MPDSAHVPPARVSSAKAPAALVTRDDLVAWLRDLMPDPYAYPDDSGSTYGEEARRLEWAARPLWAVFSLLASGEYPADLVGPYLRRMADGLTPGHPLAFPDPTLKTRQIVIEQEVFGYGLMVAAPQVLALLTPAQQERLAAWLNKSNQIELPWGSWFCSRVLINAGLSVAGLPYDEARLAADLHAIDSMYSGGGWYENGRPFQRDYYVPLSFQSVAMLVARFAPGLVADVATTVSREAAFEDDFVCWFDPLGRSVPYGRSLFYRFGHAAFWAAAAVSGIHARPMGQVKHLLMQHLRWWHEHLYGGLVPGYAYPMDCLVENYCAPGSAMRALRAFVVLSLPSTDKFWTTAEKDPRRPERRAQPEPGVLAVCGPHHTCLYPVTQFGGPAVSHGMSKYGKLCYSSAFSWNLSRDVRGLANAAVDSCLALSVAGLDQYASRERPDMGEVTEAFAHSTWHLGEAARVETWVVPLSEVTHVRVHRIEAFCALDTCEGAFPLFNWNPKVDEPEERGAGKIVLSRTTRAGLRWRSGILDGSVVAQRVLDVLLDAGLESVVHGFTWAQRQEDVVLQDPNTNLYSFERTAVPVLKAKIAAGTTWFASLVVGEPGV